MVYYNLLVLSINLHYHLLIKKLLMRRLVVILFLLSINNGFSSNIILISDSNDRRSISKKAEVLEDSLSLFSIEGVFKSSFFVLNKGDHINKPPGSSYWIKLSVKNVLNTPIKKYLSLTSNDIFFVDFYQLSNVGLIKQKVLTGNKRNFKSRPIAAHDYTFSFILKSQELNFIYLKIDRKYQALNTDILLENDRSLIEHNTKRSFRAGFTVGGILFYLLIAIALFIFNRSAINFNYLIYILGSTIFMLSFNDGLRYVWPNWPYFQDPSTFVGPTMILTGHIGVFRLFFDVKSYNKYIDYFFQTLRFIGVFLIVGFLFADKLGMLYYRFYQVMGFLFLICFVSFISIGFLIYLKKRRADHLWFLISIIFMVLSASLILLVELGPLDRKKFEFAFSHLPLITLYYEAGLLAFFLIKKIYDEKIAYEQKIIEERQLIVEGLHDEVISSFGGLKTSFNNFINEEIDDSIKSKVKKVDTSMGNVLTKLREVTHVFNNSKKYLDEIIAEVRLYANETLEAKNIFLDFTFIEDATETILPIQISRNLKGFFKEVIYNAIKHSSAKNFKMHITKDKNIISINISDDGVGFNLDKNNTNGMGLRNLNSRAKKMKAKEYSYATKPNEGVMIKLVLDLNKFNKSDYI